MSDYKFKLDLADHPIQSEISNYEKVLDLGCGRRHLKGENVTTIDRDRRCDPDSVWDLSEFPYPFEDNTFDFIHFSQVLEHLSDTVKVIGEILRIGKIGCHVFISVPHYSSSVAYRDPTHLKFFSVKSIDYFCSNYFHYEHNNCFEIVSSKVTFSKMWKFTGIASLFNLFQRAWEDKLTGIFNAKYIEWNLKIVEYNPTNIQ